MADHCVVKGFTAGSRMERKMVLLPKDWMQVPSCCLVLYRLFDKPSPSQEFEHVLSSVYKGSDNKCRPIGHIKSILYERQVAQLPRGWYFHAVPLHDRHHTKFNYIVSSSFPCPSSSAPEDQFGEGVHLRDWPPDEAQLHGAAPVAEDPPDVRQGHWTARS